MSSDLTYTLSVDQSPQEVFNAVNNVRGWWSEEIEGDTEKLNSEFTYHFENVHRCKMRIIESIPDKKIAWLVLENYFDFTKDNSEWTGNRIEFLINSKDNITQLQFTQKGLVPDYECYDICRNAWGNYINNSLRCLIESGKGSPNGKGKPRTEDEKKLSSTK